MNHRLSIATALVAGLITLAPAIAGDDSSKASRTYIVNERPGNLNGLPFSDGVLVGDTLYIGGHLALDPATGQAPADAKVEAQLLMDGIRKTVEKAGLTMNDIVSLTVYCTDLKLYDTFNGIYRGSFDGKYPARAFIGVATLLRGAHFEIQGIAVRR